jgi:hypothetical protein
MCLTDQAIRLGVITMADAKWQPAGPPRKGDNPGNDPAVQDAVAKIKQANRERR